MRWKAEMVPVTDELIERTNVGGKVHIFADHRGRGHRAFLRVKKVHGRWTTRRGELKRAEVTTFDDGTTIAQYLLWEPEIT